MKYSTLATCLFPVLATVGLSAASPLPPPSSIPSTPSPFPPPTSLPSTDTPLPTPRSIPSTDTPTSIPSTDDPLPPTSGIPTDLPTPSDEAVSKPSSFPSFAAIPFASLPSAVPSAVPLSLIPRDGEDAPASPPVAPPTEDTYIWVRFDGGKTRFYKWGECYPYAVNKRMAHEGILLQNSLCYNMETDDCTGDPLPPNGFILPRGTDMINEEGWISKVGRSVMCHQAPPASPEIPLAANNGF